MRVPLAGRIPSRLQYHRALAAPTGDGRAGGGLHPYHSGWGWWSGTHLCATGGEMLTVRVRESPADFAAAPDP